MDISKSEFMVNFKDCLYEDYYIIDPKEATPYQVHSAISKVILARLSKQMKKNRNEHIQVRHAYYFSAEFLVGRAIYNNLLNLGLLEMIQDMLDMCGLSISMLEEIEDAALGNGGLGRLAACYLDSAATLNLPLDGYGIRYRYGLFKQEIEDGFQVELADDWTAHGDPWSKRNEGESVTIKFADQMVKAVPYDIPVLGWKTENTGCLRLWQSESLHPFDFRLFNAQKYDEAVREKNRAEDISRVLYPNDDTWEGKILRLKQQYFFCCASITDILRTFEKTHGNNYFQLGEYIAIQLNDTHPVISIPELIRQLMDRRMEFDDALSIAKQVFHYTNHTIMSEALEKWPFDLMKQVIPNVLDIIVMIENSLVKEMMHKKLSDEQTAALRIIDQGTVFMARLAIYISRVTNGVARIHTEILKRDTLKEWYAIYPERFQNKTNGITQRRWLALCNQELTAFIKMHLGSDLFITDLKELKKLAPLAEDEQILDEFIEIKNIKKRQLADFIYKNDMIKVNPETIFDVQIKRLHEYKRQLLNAFSILYIYFGIKDGSIHDFVPTTFIFSAKSAPGYQRAKGIIKYINEIAELLNSDPATQNILKVVFVKNYNVSAAEKLVSGADVSVQISTAGTEASGTGNMKLMLNGAVTLGTLDGANIEIVEEAGAENNYIFGAKVEELHEIMPAYNPRAIYESDEKIKRVVDTLINGTFSDGGSGIFSEIYHSLLDGVNWQKPDVYYLMGDFISFVNARIALNQDYKDGRVFAKKCFLNMCYSGKFSSDRAIRHYAKEIWKIEPINTNR